MTGLSEDLWTIVLRYFPLAARLGSCALVCRTFHAAAVTATEDITATFAEQSAVDNLVQYLQQHGRHVTSVTATFQGVSSSNLGVLSVLPSCQHLQELNLTCFSVQQDPQQHFSRVFDSITGLTRLELEDSCVNGKPVGGFTALSVLVNLQHLSVAYVDCQKHPDAPALSGIGWSTMQHPTELYLDWVTLAAEDLQHLSSMSRLKFLNIHGLGRLTLDIAPGFCLPASLRDVDLAMLDLDASVLAAADRLTRLRLESVTVCPEGGVSGGECLLRVLAKLQKLDSLSLLELTTAWPAPCPVYQGVAASRKLREFAWRDCLLLHGAVSYMFPAAHEHRRRLSKLATFIFMGNNTAFAPDDVVRLVSSCPALQQLQLGVQGGSYLAPLSQLSALTSLKVDIHADHNGTAMSIQGLAGLTGLRELDLWSGQSGTAAALGLVLPLTALRQLHELVWYGREACWVNLRLETLAGPGQPPDVWLQLLERCAADSECQAAIPCNLAQQLAAQEATNTQQQQELTDLRQQLAEQEATNSQQQQDLTDLRQQLAEQEATNSQQQQDLTGLRQQLAEQQQLNAALQQQVAGHGAQLQALEAKFQQLQQLLRL